MTGPKIKQPQMVTKAPPVTREALESFIWAATGWRGDAKVIDGILARVDDHVALKISQVDQAPAEIDRANARIVELSAELDADRAALRAALDTVKKLSTELHEAEGKQPVPTVERATVKEILELLTTAMQEAAGAVGTSARTVNALAAVTDALRAADGLVKDIRLTAQDQTAATEQEWANLTDADVAQIEADDEPAAQTITLEIVTDGDAQTARALGYVIATEHIEQAEADRLMEAEAAVVDAAEQWASAEFSEPEARELPASVGLGQGPDDLSQREGFGEPSAAPDDEDDPEMVAMIAEIEADILATGRGAKCTKCDNVKVWENFYKDKQAANGHKGACKSCESDQKRKRETAQMSTAIAEVMTSEV
jgi:hypothetical protein